MTRPPRALCALAMTVVLAGCASAPELASTASARPPATTSASPQTLSEAKGRLLPVVASAPAGSVGARWTLLAVADGGRRVLLETVASGGCAAFVGVQVSQGATLVTISPRTVVNKPAGALCPDHEVLTMGSVELSAPLGGRRLSEGDPRYPR